MSNKKQITFNLMLLIAMLFLPNIMLGAGISVARAGTLKESERNAIFP